MADAQSLSPEDPRSLGHYELLGRLGEGAQGIVFLARDTASGQQVALKLLRAHLSSSEAPRSRFLREMAAAKRVARFCTAQVLDADLAGEQPYIVSEYIPGPSLSAVVRGQGPRTGTALERIAVNTATALAGIHQAGIVHRDFKAANVVLGPDGPVVIDFGIAKALDAVDSDLTLTGQSAGTPGYMAPEQFRGGPAGPAVDVFAWGVTMAFAATGVLPFGTGEVAAVMYRILSEPPQLDGLSAPLRDLVAACLEKDPAARPTARDIVDRLLGWGEASGAETAAAAAVPAQPPAGFPAPPPAGFAAQPPAPGQPAGFSGPPPAGPPVPGAAGPDATPPLDAGRSLTVDPIQAVPMEPLLPPGTGSPGPAAGSGGSRRVLVWAAAAVAVVVLAGVAVAVKMLTGSPAAGGPPRLRAAAAALPTGSVAAASPSVPPGRTGKKKRAGAPHRAHTGGAPGAASHSATGSRSGAATGQPKVAGSPAASAPAKTSPPPAPGGGGGGSGGGGSPNPYTPGQVCGPGYGVIDSHALSGGTIYLLYDSANGDNCVTTMRSPVSGPIYMTATLKVQSGGSQSDSGQYTDYAGPVRLPARATCVEWGGSIGSSSWMSGWSHCG